MHAVRRSKSGDHLKTRPEKPTGGGSQYPGIQERRGATGHDARSVLFVGIAVVMTALPQAGAPAILVSYLV
jgi:hypothetical protein